MRRLIAVLLAMSAAVGVTVALAQEERRDPRAAPASAQQALPEPGVAIARTPAALARQLTGTTRRLRAALPGWDTSDPVPRDVTYLALHHQRMLRFMAASRKLGDATIDQLPREVRGEARDTVRARRDLAAIPRDEKNIPPVRVAAAASAADLRRHYDAAQRRFGVHWSILASINFVESAFGRVRSASEAGAQGPMQFLPSTWRQYGMGGDIDDPRDAILAAANYLRASGAPGNIDRALFAYNHSTSYVRAIRRFASRMRSDERTFATYYAWQVFVRTSGGGARRLTGPGRG